MRTFSSVSSMMGVGVWVGVGVVAMGVAESVSSGGGFGLTREATDNLRALSAIFQFQKSTRSGGKSEGRKGGSTEEREGKPSPTSSFTCNPPTLSRGAHLIDIAYP